MSSTRIFGITAVALALGLTACSGDDTSVPSPDAGKDGAVADTGTPQGDSSTDAGTLPADAATEAAVDASTGSDFVATLTGAEETPPIATAEKGTATFTLSADKKTLTYHLTHNVANASIAHVHLGGGGESGNPIYPIDYVGGDTRGVLALTAADVANLEAGLLYVNVHSTGAGVAGEIRGQILRPGEKLYVAKLKGAEETPPVVSTASASAAVILDGAKATLRFHVVTTGLTPTAAHIHKGLATEKGGVEVPLSPLGTKIDGTAPVTPAQVADLEAGHLYANVHTTANPEGEIRGQILVPGEVLYAALLKGANEVPPNASTATGNAQFILDYAKAKLRYEGKLTGITTTAAHIHTGSSGAVLYPLTLAAPGFVGTQVVTAADVTALDAAGLYANAHSAAFKDGEIRGTIAKP